MTMETPISVILSWLLVMYIQKLHIRSYTMIFAFFCTWMHMMCKYKCVYIHANASTYLYDLVWVSIYIIYIYGSVYICSIYVSCTYVMCFCCIIMYQLHHQILTSWLVSHSQGEFPNLCCRYPGYCFSGAILLCPPVTWRWEILLRWCPIARFE